MGKASSFVNGYVPIYGSGGSWGSRKEVSLRGSVYQDAADQIVTAVQGHDNHSDVLR